MDFSKYKILDGAMGTMLQKSGLPLESRPEILNITHPQIIQDIHKKYIDAGADIIYANTFGANDIKLQKTGFTSSQIVEAGIKIAKNATINTDVKVALDMGPLGELLYPSGTMSLQQAYSYYKTMAIAGEKAGADIAVIETMTDLYEVKSAVLAVKENTSLPIFVSMTFEQNGRTFTGCDIPSFVALAQGLGVDCVGINCSLGPSEIYPLAKQLCSNTYLPVFVKPNAGLPDPNTNLYNISPSEFCSVLEQYKQLGVCMVGGCCGTTPEYIQKLACSFVGEVEKRQLISKSVVSSATLAVEINDVTVIGERINPTGKKLMKQALLDNDLGYILNQAKLQQEAGAKILDVNVGTPGVNECEMLPKVVLALQEITNLPLQLDSSNSQALENALRVYNGKPIVNSVNGDDEVLDTILPLVKKYGASVIGLTLDSKGIPLLAEDRLKIAEKIYNRCLYYGIKKEDIFIDCLTLTASAQQEGAQQTLKAVHLVKKELGLKTVLGVSNISFGLPNRELLNKSFLLLALQSGLDLPIINPNIISMMDTIQAFRVLYNRDTQATEYINEFTSRQDVSEVKVVKVVDKVKDYHPLIKAVKDGLEKESVSLTIEMLKNTPPMDIVNNYLIKALDIVGELFEKGKFFLPQLLQAANASKGAFEEIKKAVSRSGTHIVKDSIIIATVKGDIHDIGKNIVKVILENYGYKVIDLGRDVDPTVIVEAVKKYKVKLVGLSALMTTTLSSMESTIKLLKSEKCNCKIFVGGAVLTEEYALKIGADYYAKDAKVAVDIAKKVLG